MVPTERTRTDGRPASILIEGIDADPLIAGKGYETDAVFEQAQRMG